MLLEKLTLKIN